MANKALLVVSFGTSHAGTREKTISAIERDLDSAFPDRKLYTGWTSGFILGKLEKEGIHIDSVREALCRMEAEGVTDLLVQPTHVTAQKEYGLLLEELGRHRGSFETIRCGKPLLATAEDAKDIAAVIPDIFGISEDEVLLFMGHGTAGSENFEYSMQRNAFLEAGLGNVLLSLVEAKPGIEEAIKELAGIKPKKVWLAPFMVVAGDHAVNDMAGEGEDSWKNILTREGYDAFCILRGLGEYPEIRALYVKHAKEAPLFEA